MGGEEQAFKGESGGAELGRNCSCRGSLKGERNCNLHLLAHNTSSSQWGHFHKWTRIISPSLFAIGKMVVQDRSYEHAAQQIIVFYHHHEPGIRTAGAIHHPYYFFPATLSVAFIRFWTDDTHWFPPCDILCAQYSCFSRTSMGAGGERGQCKRLRSLGKSHMGHRWAGGQTDGKRISVLHGRNKKASRTLESHTWPLEDNPELSLLSRFSAYSQKG